MSAEEEEYEEEELSLEEKTNIVRYFINNAPPGHTDKIIEAAKAIGAEDVLTEAGIAEFLRDYNLAYFKPVQLEDGSNVVISPQTAVGDVTANEFFQPSTNKVITYDHVSGAVGATRDATAEETGGDAERRDAIQKVCML